jgi:tRNA pseudouridine38-40 synthase
MRNLKLLIEYDGTNYCGWQVQPNLPTIQGTIKEKIQQIEQGKITLIGAARTDAGVHAEGQVANFHSISFIPPNNLLRALNGVLPPDIRIKKIEEVSENFHARYTAQSRLYRYSILNRRISSVFYYRYFHLVPTPLNLELMMEASRYLLGTHDFSSFGNADEGSNPVRTVKNCRWVKRGDFIFFYIEANAFLRGMVRSIVGTVLGIGKGKLTPPEIKNILEIRKRQCSGPASPARGLCLVKVGY